MNNLMDDTFGVAQAHEIVKFKDKTIPKDQALLLLLFDTLEFPWEWKKQLHGPDLEVIGFYLRPNELVFSLTPEKKEALVSHIHQFLTKPARNLREWQQLLGWCSWALNVFPLGRFALQSAWDKTAGKSRKMMNIPINKEVQNDLRWLAEEFKASDEVRLLDASIWQTSEAESIFTADACPTGYGVWEPNTAIGHHGTFTLPSRDVYWAELYAVAHAIEIGIGRNHKKILICSDSRNICDLFLSHRPRPIVKDLFASIIKLIIKADADVRVAHLPGEKNVFADALSRGELSKVRRLLVSSTILEFKLPSYFPDGGKRPGKNGTFNKQTFSISSVTNRC